MRLPPLCHIALNDARIIRFESESIELSTAIYMIMARESAAQMQRNLLR